MARDKQTNLLKLPNAWGVLPRVFIPILVILMGIAGFFLWRARANTEYARTFSANGVVEQADYKNDQCSVKVAIYEWINLGGEFKIADIPQQSDRYIIHGFGEACRALPVAMTATNQHISFEVGYTKEKWVFIKNPAAALSCGGVNMNWKPEPER